MGVGQMRSTQPGGIAERLPRPRGFDRPRGLADRVPTRLPDSESGVDRAIRHKKVRAGQSDTRGARRDHRCGHTCRLHPTVWSLRRCARPSMSVRRIIDPKPAEPTDRHTQQPSMSGENKKPIDGARRTNSGQVLLTKSCRRPNRQQRGEARRKRMRPRDLFRYDSVLPALPALGSSVAGLRFAGLDAEGWRGGTTGVWTRIAHSDSTRRDRFAVGRKHRPGRKS